jgi:hypothetical protein
MGLAVLLQAADGRHAQFISGNSEEVSQNHTHGPFLLDIADQLVEIVADNLP